MRLGRTNLISSSSGSFAEEVGLTNENFFSILLSISKRPKTEPKPFDTGLNEWIKCILVNKIDRFSIF